MSNNSSATTMILPSQLLTPEDIEEIYRELERPRKKIQQVVKRKMIKPRALLCPIVSENFYNIKSQDVNPADIKHDASFMNYRPTVSARSPEAVAMMRQVINVGKGPSNDVDLLKFGHCNYIAPHHATIYYDQDSKCFELINYAPRGTRINNIWYCNDVTKVSKSPETYDDQMGDIPLQPEDKNALEGSQMAYTSSQAASSSSQGRGAISRRNYRLARVPNTKVPNPERTELECACKSRLFERGQGGEELKNFSEDSAILGHAALLSFGCIGFVFSIIDQG